MQSLGVTATSHDATKALTDDEIYKHKQQKQRQEDEREGEILPERGTMPIRQTKPRA